MAVIANLVVREILDSRGNATVEVDVVLDTGAGGRAAEATNRGVGCGIAGPNAGDLIAETALAIEIGADAEDIGLTVHPHPTLSETGAVARDVRRQHH
jgi:pyruvate/2-oxoglutarate dehydrogenase complex dihydrolipoamide dehydrogenase (E3) component